MAPRCWRYPGVTTCRRNPELSPIPARPEANQGSLLRVLGSSVRGCFFGMVPASSAGYFRPDDGRSDQGQCPVQIALGSLLRNGRTRTRPITIITPRIPLQHGLWFARTPAGKMLDTIQPARTTDRCIAYSYVGWLARKIAGRPEQAGTLILLSGCRNSPDR